MRRTARVPGLPGTPCGWHVTQTGLGPTFTYVYYDNHPPDPLLPIFTAALRARRQLTFILAPSLGRHCGLTNIDDAVIFLDESNTPGETRATIGHELLHLVHPDLAEHHIEGLTAEALIPRHAALAAHRTGRHAEWARRLGVDTQLLRRRIRGLPHRDDYYRRADGVG